MKNKQIILIGGGGHCRVVISILKELPEYEIFGITDFKENIGKDILDIKINKTDETKKKLARTGQDYLAKGLYKIAQRHNIENYNGKKKIVFSGGVAYNQYISSYMLKKGVLLNKFAPSGDGGISFGQIKIANSSGCDK